MGRRTLTELLFIVAGLAIAWALSRLAMWSYPLGRDAIWWCGVAGMAAAVVLGAGPLVRAVRADRARR